MQRRHLPEVFERADALAEFWQRKWAGRICSWLFYKTSHPFFWP